MSGYTITFVPWEDLEGKQRVYGRYKTKEEKDVALEKIYEMGNGWLEEELQTVMIHEDYNYMLDR